jgi:glycosyltransferase involved in cell wall biosynthesis
MRVLFVNSRPDAEENPGGDNVQLQKTRTALEDLGVSVQVRPNSALNQLPEFDVAHIFNMQMPEAAWEVFVTLQAYGKPVVLSSIYWDTLEHWAETAVTSHSRWQSVAARLGKARTHQLYIRWQRLKEPLFDRWRIQRRLLQRVARVLPNSQSEAALLQNTFALSQGFGRRVTVVPNGIDPDLYRQLPLPSERFVQEHRVQDFVLQVGSINPVKNQLALIEALYDLPVPLVFIGQPLTARPDYFAACQELAAQRGNVLFLNRVPYEELPAIYALAAVHVLPSWRETPGLVSLEAAAAGCKIVTTPIGSTRDYFADLAWYCYPNDRRAICQAVEAALQAPRSLALRERILSAYTWEQAGRATLAAYQAVLEPQG